MARASLQEAEEEAAQGLGEWSGHEAGEAARRASGGGPKRNEGQSPAYSGSCAEPSTTSKVQDLPVKQSLVAKRGGIVNENKVRTSAQTA